jgi:hypothetical protein
MGEVLPANRNWDSGDRLGSRRPVAARSKREHVNHRNKRHGGGGGCCGSSADDDGSSGSGNWSRCCGGSSGGRRCGRDRGGGGGCSRGGGRRSGSSRSNDGDGFLDVIILVRAEIVEGQRWQDGWWWRRHRCCLEKLELGRHLRHERLLGGGSSNLIR